MKEKGYIHFTEKDMPFIITECECYALQECNKEQQDKYLNELYNVDEDFYLLVNSGIFHDAIGKCVKVTTLCYEYTAIVVEEY